ncbi:glycosyltransferase [Flavobacterium daejeonense]|uniref:glycosyltransferase n=1 Tax=Flavobacterium daejeonense TaxID=350893 RepID=UPI00047AD6EA|nr:glycosyltransferase [Flavobacterium daejeonense]
MSDQFFIVLVLYKMSLSESKTIQSLGKFVSNNTPLLVFDNSPTRQYEESVFQHENFKIQYVFDESNPGLSKAYNFALQKAIERGAIWMLLLDQDTHFTADYYDEVVRLLQKPIPNHVAAIMPRVQSHEGDSLISPTQMHSGAICRPVKVASGISKLAVSGINSGTLLRVNFINSISGFSEKYSLDMLDHWYFRMIYKTAHAVYIMNSCIYQELSVLGNYEATISLSRYQQMLRSEFLFVKEEGILSLLIFKCRLLFRILKQLRFTNSGYWQASLRQLFT